VTIVEDVIRRVAMVDVASEVAEGERAIHEAAGARGGTIRMVAHGEDARDSTVLGEQNN